MIERDGIRWSVISIDVETLRMWYVRHISTHFGRPPSDKEWEIFAHGILDRSPVQGKSLRPRKLSGGS